MKRYFYAWVRGDGRILGVQETATPPREMPRGWRQVAEGVSSSTHYFAGEELRAYTAAQLAVLRAGPPSAGFEWSVQDFAWVDTRSLEEARADQWAAIKRRRDELEAAGFDVEGIGRFDSDGPARARLQLELLAAQAGGPDYRTEWTLADNTVVELDAAAMARVGLAMHAHTARVHAAARAARRRLAETQSVKAAAAVELKDE